MMSVQRLNPYRKISVIIVNWNKKELLEECLKSLEAQTVKDVEVIVVDNGSTDGSVELILGEFQGFVKLIRNERNLGFAKGNNIGIENAKADYIMTLNNDTRLSGDCIERLLNAVDSSHENIGMWGPKILSMETPDEIDSVGGLLVSMDGIGKGRGRQEEDKGQFDRIRTILLPSACAAIYKRKMLEEVGLFDGDFFAYCEDTDLGLRARLMGWEALSVPEAKIYHSYSATGGGYSPLKAFLVERNHFWVVLKNFPPGMVALLPFLTIWRYSVQVYGIITRRGSGGRFVERSSPLILLFILVKSYFCVILSLPRIMRKRRKIQRNRKISSREMYESLKAHRLSVKNLVLMD